jgi:hypothetical protein
MTLLRTEESIRRTDLYVKETLTKKGRQPERKNNRMESLSGAFWFEFVMTQKNTPA